MFYVPGNGRRDQFDGDSISLQLVAQFDGFPHMKFQICVPFSKGHGINFRQDGKYVGQTEMNGSDSHWNRPCHYHMGDHAAHVELLLFDVSTVISDGDFRADIADQNQPLSLAFNILGSSDPEINQYLELMLCPRVCYVG